MRDIEEAAAVRVALCSATIDAYCTGIDQPAKSTIRPPWATCQSCSDVFASGLAIMLGRAAGVYVAKTRLIKMPRMTR